ncbi:MAG: Com family DNA-binding transcriptional regulator [Burkholderiaceae bacterium]|nr:Com family DNA-binding transcriptional regulator [Burkholderiaceae bacterium]
MKDIRCGACSRKLGAGQYTCLVIKCPRCGVMNTLRVAPSAGKNPTPERPGASMSERTTLDGKADKDPESKPSTR